MAKKYLMSFGLEDVLRVILQCKHCGGELSFAVTTRMVVPQRCPVCQEYWDSPQQALDYKQKTELLMGMLRGFSAMPKPGSADFDRVPWDVRLVIESGPGSSGEDVQEGA